MYTSNLAALLLVVGLFEQGMFPGATLAFLVAGPTTTIPARTAVYGIAKLSWEHCYKHWWQAVTTTQGVSAL